MRSAEEPSVGPAEAEGEVAERGVRNHQDIDGFEHAIRLADLEVLPT
jgi:hypothetical protein